MIEELKKMFKPYKSYLNVSRIELDEKLEELTNYLNSIIEKDYQIKLNQLEKQIRK